MTHRIAVIIPCYKVKPHILDVLKRIGPEVDFIYVVDDACPDGSADYVDQNCGDSRVKILRRTSNGGVGAAVLTGYRQALNDGADILVKIDGDGQMDPALINRFVSPILNGRADYTKGNRFYDLTHIQNMPVMRLVGNATLSFASKLSTGYWNLFDTTNGYTAMHAKVAKHLPFDKISRRYFFETDILFRLNTIRAVVMDVPMDASYGDEVSNLRIRSILGEFIGKHLRNFGLRIFYNYFLRDVTAASLELVAGSFLLAFGMIFGLIHWMSGVQSGVPSAPGVVMLAALPTLVGLQLLLAFLNYDISSTPRQPIYPVLPD